MCAGTCWMLRAFLFFSGAIVGFNHGELWWWWRRLAVVGVVITTVTLSEASVSEYVRRTLKVHPREIACDYRLMCVVISSFTRMLESAFPFLVVGVREHERDSLSHPLLARSLSETFLVLAAFPYKLRWKSADSFSRLRRVVAVDELLALTRGTQRPR